MRLVHAFASAAVALLAMTSVAAAADEADTQAELAKKLQNPVANLISVPVQSNWDFGIGPARAMRYTANVQPVIPFSLTADWNLITRTILPVIHAESPVKGGDDHSGTGDILQSFFLSPAEPVAGWILGAGPVFLYPSASDDALCPEQWGAGPTAVVLQQRSGWTYGALANHVWSFAGTESSYDWEHSEWTVPLNAFVTQLLEIAGQPVSFTVGGRYHAAAPSGGPDWGLRFVVTLLFPK